MAQSVPLLSHPYLSPSAFTPEALVRAVRTERGIGSEKVPPVCMLDFDGDLTDWLIQEGLVLRCTSWACFHTTMYVIRVDGFDYGIVPRTIGGPYAVLVAEQLRISGANVIIGLASAGRVLDSLPLPSLVIATNTSTSFCFKQCVARDASMHCNSAAKRFGLRFIDERCDS